MQQQSSPAVGCAALAARRGIKLQEQRLRHIYAAWAASTPQTPSRARVGRRAAGLRTTRAGRRAAARRCVGRRSAAYAPQHALVAAPYGFPWSRRRRRHTQQ